MATPEFVEAENGLTINIFQKLAGFQAIIPEFDGKSAVTPKYFIDHVEQITAVTNCSQTEKLIVLKSRIRGEALTHLIHSPDLSQETNYDAFKRNFLAFFQKKTSSATTQQQFANCRMQHKEPVKIYAARVSEVTRNFFGNADISIPEINALYNQTKLSKFLEGLSLEYKQAIIIKDPTNFQDAVNFIEILETNEENFSNPINVQKFHENINIIERSQSPTNTDVLRAIETLAHSTNEKVAALTTELEQLKLPQAQSSQNQRTPPNMRRSVQNNNTHPRRSFSPISRRQYACEICGRTNHSTRECFYAVPSHSRPPSRYSVGQNSRPPFHNNTTNSHRQRHQQNGFTNHRSNVSFQSQNDRKNFRLNAVSNFKAAHFRPPYNVKNIHLDEPQNRTVSQKIKTINTQKLHSPSNHFYLPVTDIRFAGYPTVSLIDTGASVSLLEWSIFSKIKHVLDVKQCVADVQIKSVTDNQINYIGCFSIPISFGHKRFFHKFFIVKNSLGPHYQAIMGYDFLKRYNCSISLQNNTLVSNNVILNLRDALSNQLNAISQEDYARLPNKTSLFPRESRTVPLKLDCNIKTGDSVTFTPLTLNNKLEMRQIVCSVDSEKNIAVPITNLSSNTIPLNKNMKLGKISENFNYRNMEKIKHLRQKELLESDFNLNHLDRTTRSKLLTLLFEFSDIFSKRLYTIGRTEALTPHFTVDRTKLPSTRPYTVPYALKDELKRQLDELESANLIERSDSHISSPLLLVKKKNLSNDPSKQQYRLVVDYRRLNAHIKYPRHNLPIIHHLLEKLRGAQYFTSLDLSSSFWQIPLKNEDRDVTSFSSPFGSYRFCCMPQGLSLSPECFAKLSDQVLAPISHLNISNYIDDFCVGSGDTDDMIFKLRQLFQRFRLFGLTINPTKCAFLLPKIQFLGHELSGSGIRPTDMNIKKITDFPAPTTVRKVRRFVGLIGYYRRFIPKFSQLSAPLTDLTRRGQKFKWTDEAQRAFEILKSKLATPPILIHPNFEKEFILSTDASDFSLGAMLGQKDYYDIIHPIAYFSKKLNAAQKRYIIRDKELLAIVEAVKSFKYYLYGRSFVIRCDNATLTKLSKLESPGDRVTRWISYLSDFNYSFQLIGSKENQVADILSRDFFLNTVQIDIPSIEKIKQAQREDKILSDIIYDLEKERNIKIKHSSPYFLSNGLLLHSGHIPRNRRDRRMARIVIPEKFKPHILAANHLAHFGFMKTYNAIRQKYFWENLYTDTKHYVDSCKHCIAYRSPNKIPPVPLQRNFMPSRPMQLISSDFIGRLPITNNGNCYIISFIDHFTKFIKLYAVPEQTAKITADKLLDFICTFGCPQFLLSDRGPNYRSDLLQNLCKRLGVEKLQTTALHPQANGQAEKINANIKRSLSIFARDTEQWDEYLNYYALIYNSSLHNATRETPGYLHLSYDLTLPTDIINEPQSNVTIDYMDYIATKTSQIQYTFEKVRDSLIEAAEKQETYQAQKAKYRDFYPGQLVYLYAPEADRNAKLPKRRNYIGPMRILQSHNKVNFTVIDTTNPKAKPQKVHAERLIPYLERKAELDYLHHIIQENKNSSTENMDKLPTSEKTHAKFDDISATDILQYTTSLSSNQLPIQNTPLPSSDFNAPLSPDSDSTQVYDFDEENSQVILPPRANSHSYNLRPRVNVTKRIFDRPETCTQSDDCVPKPIRFLEKISHALKNNAFVV